MEFLLKSKSSSSISLQSWFQLIFCMFFLKLVSTDVDAGIDCHFIYDPCLARLPALLSMASSCSAVYGPDVLVSVIMISKSSSRVFPSYTIRFAQSRVDEIMNQNRNM